MENIKSNLICPICVSTLNECCVTKCGHSFCQFCLKESLKYSSKCPYCNTVLKQDDFYRCYLFDSLINSIEGYEKTLQTNPQQHSLSQSQYMKNPNVSENQNPMEDVVYVDEDDNNSLNTQKEIKEINQQQLICIDNNVNGKMISSEQKLVSLPYNLNDLISQYTQDAKELSEISMTTTSNSFPIIVQTPIAPIKIQIKSQKEEMKLCLRKRFEQGMLEEFYQCNTCNMKFICSHCKEVCHKDHNIVPFIRLTCSSAVCYCFKCPSKCKCMN